MADLRATLKAVLTADGTLTGLLPGGVFLADDIDTPSDGGWKWSPKEGDGMTLQAHAIIRWGDSVPSEPFAISPEQAACTIFAYHDSSYATLDSIMSRMKMLLHDTYLQADDRSLAHVRLAFIGGDVPAEEYQRKPSKFIRFEITQVRS